MSDNLEGFELDFSDTNTTEQQANQQNTQAQAQQQVPQGQYGPNTLRAYTVYQQAQNEYKSLLEQVKKLREVGAEVPYELEAQVGQMAAKLAVLERDVEEAQRRDALNALPGLISKYTSNLAPEVAKFVTPYLQSAFQEALTTMPGVVNNPQALDTIASYAIGRALQDRMVRSGKSGAQTQAVTTTEPPPGVKDNTQAAPPPDEVRTRWGVDENVWSKAKDLPELGWADIDL